MAGELGYSSVVLAVPDGYLVFLEAMSADYFVEGSTES